MRMREWSAVVRAARGKCIECRAWCDVEGTAATERKVGADAETAWARQRQYSSNTHVVCLDSSRDRPSTTAPLREPGRGGCDIDRAGWDAHMCNERGVYKDCHRALPQRAYAGGSARTFAILFFCCASGRAEVLAKRRRFPSLCPTPIYEQRRRFFLFGSCLFHHFSSTQRIVRIGQMTLELLITARIECRKTPATPCDGCGRVRR